MSKFKTALMLLKKDKVSFTRGLALNMMNMKLLHHMNDKTFLEIIYWCYFNRRLNLKNPQTFNEKLQWIKLYDRKSEYSLMVDKYEVKRYVEERIGGQYIIKTYGIWDRFEDIDFTKLPETFVLKCTHDSGSVVLVKEKSNLDYEMAREKINRGLSHNLFYYGREWPYKNVKPRIIAEEMLVDPHNEDLKDYKFFCFNGKVKCFKVDFDRFTNHGANYYSPDMELLPFGEVVCPPDFNKTIQFPEAIDQMIFLAEKLAQGHKFLRVDFYCVDNRIYFGEMTFFPATGFGPFTDEKWDYKLGSWIDLNN